MAALGSCRGALKCTPILDPMSSSDKSEEMEEVTPTAEIADSSFISMWRDPFDASKLPQAISLALIKRAHFLLGSDHAQYPTESFKHTGGLCARGYKFKQLSSDDLFPLHALVGTYPVSKKGNRHPLKLIADRQTARDALHMYQRVYDGTQPDNGEFGTSFIRGLALFYQKNMDVNWAERASELAIGRMKSPGKNPIKLTPPCLREQIQAMINLFAHYLIDAYQRLQAACKSKSVIKKGLPLPQPPVAQLATVGRSEQRREEVNFGSHERRSTSNVGKHEAEREATNAEARKPNPMHALRVKQREAEGRLKYLLQQTQDLKIEAALQEQLLSQLAAAEENCWDEHHELRQRAKAVVASDAERARLNDAVQAKGHEVTAATAVVESTKLLFSKAKSDLQDSEGMVEKLNREIENMKVDIGILLVESIRIQPQSYSSLLPAEATIVPNIKMSDPCASCRKYFAHLALVPFSCGCLFHPHCMFKTTLLENVVCPQCLQAPTRPWMVQWGFASNIETMTASIEATKATSRALGWEPKQGSSASASKKVEEVKQFIEEHTTRVFHIAKRSAVDATMSASADRGKQICSSSLPASQMPDTGLHTDVSLERGGVEVMSDACNMEEFAVADVVAEIQGMEGACNVEKSAEADVVAAIEGMQDACNMEESAVATTSNLGEPTVARVLSDLVLTPTQSPCL